jgi:hypothetical protein
MGSLGLHGRPIATVTAGWQEREDEDQELNDALGGGAINLRLYGRVHRVFGRDQGFANAHRELQRAARELRRIYWIRLDPAMQTVTALMHEPNGGFVAPDREAAFQTLRGIDEWQLERARELRARFAERWRFAERPAIAAERAEVAAIVRRAAAVVVAGGHVATLMNRMRIMGLPGLLGGKTIVAWSAGAMALSEKVVLFHDSPPYGQGNAEVFEDGFGLYRGVLALPDGSRRLRLDDRLRVSRFARRFAPARSVVLDGGTRLDWHRGRWSAPAGATALRADGNLEVIREW